MPFLEIILPCILINMHLNILNAQQVDLLPFIKKYINNYYMVGGTAIALHIGHRASIDFDLFTAKKISPTTIKSNVLSCGFRSNIIVQKANQIHFVVNGVKLTYFEFPFAIDAPVFHQKIFRIPSLLTLGAMKAFALGGRGKWKDYVDLYFIIKYHHSIPEICTCAKTIFTDVFNPILFRKQLGYFDDISFEEQIEFIPGFEVSEEDVKAFLIEAALEEF